MNKMKRTLLKRYGKIANETNINKEQRIKWWSIKVQLTAFDHWQYQQNLVSYKKPSYNKMWKLKKEGSILNTTHNIIAYNNNLVIGSWIGTIEQFGDWSTLSTVCQKTRLGRFSFSRSAFSNNRGNWEKKNTNTDLIVLAITKS